MDVTYTVAALKGLKAMPKADATRIRVALEQVAETNPRRMPFATELVGRPGAWRLRKGDWRAVYEIIGGELVVVAVGPRGSIYDR